MGDVVLAAAVLEYLHRTTPDAQVDLVTGALYAPLFEGDPRVSTVIAYDRDNPGAAAARISGTSYDRVVDLQHNRRSAVLVRAAGCRVVGRFSKRRISRALLLLTRINTYRRGNGVTERYLQAAGWDGRDSGEFAARIARALPLDEDTAKLARFDEAEQTLGLIPFCAWKNKQWPVERFTQVAQNFVGRNWRVLVFGGPDDREEAEALCAAVGTGCVSVAGRIPLAQSAALLSRCRAVLGGDTGLTHLARAVDTPAAAIFGATTWHWGFQQDASPSYRALQVPLWCRPCHAHGGNRCMRGGRLCLTRLSVSAAIGALDHVINASTPTTQE